MAIRLSKYLRQDCLVWEKIGNDPSGKPKYATNPVALKVRWDDLDVQVLTTTGRTIVSKTKLMCASEIKEGAIVWRGTVDDWRLLPTYPARPSPIDDAFEVISTGETPDLRGRDFLFVAYLSKK